jgi:hypothetical protein
MTVLMDFSKLSTPGSTPPNSIFYRPEHTFTTLQLKERYRGTGHYVGQNSFEAKAVVATSDKDEFGVLLPDETVSWLQSLAVPSYAIAHMPVESRKMLGPENYQPSFSFAISAEKAKELKPNLRTVVVGTVPNAHVYQKRIATSRRRSAAPEN